MPERWVTLHGDSNYVREWRLPVGIEFPDGQRKDVSLSVQHPARLPSGCFVTGVYVPAAAAGRNARFFDDAQEADLHVEPGEDLTQDMGRAVAQALRKFNEAILRFEDFTAKVGPDGAITVLLNGEHYEINVERKEAS